MTADPQAPLTEAGRALERRIVGMQRDYYGLAADVRSIEAEAAANERARLAALVEGLPRYANAGATVYLEDVLDLLRAGAAG